MKQINSKVDINEVLVERVLLLGQLFSMSLRDSVCMLEYQEETSSFGLNTAIGRLEGTFLEKEQFKTAFHLHVEGKRYNQLVGVQHISSEGSRKGIHCRFLQDENPLFSINMEAFEDGNGVIQICKSYLHSPLPYEHVSLRKEDVFSFVHQKRMGRVFDVDTKVVQDGRTLFCGFGPVSYEKEGCFSTLEEAHQEIVRNDPTAYQFIEQIHDALRFEKVDLYENFVSSCFKESLDMPNSMPLFQVLDASFKRPYQKKNSTF